MKLRIGQNSFDGLSNEEDQLAILKFYAKKKPMHQDVQLESIAKITLKYTAAYRKQIIETAAQTAALEKSSVITMKHLMKAYYSIKIC